jgi:hypothetical protein
VPSRLACSASADYGTHELQPPLLQSRHVPPLMAQSWFVTHDELQLTSWLVAIRSSSGTCTAGSLVVGVWFSQPPRQMARVTSSWT